MSEEEFLRSTPRKLFALADIHLKVNSPNEEKEKEKEVKEEFIDNILL